MRAAIYARVSTEAQEKQATIDSQVADLRKAVAKAGSVLVKEHVDDGYSGALMDRPALDRLRDDAKQKLFDEVWIHCPDRLSRKSLHLAILRDELTKHGIRIVYLNRPDAKDTPEDRLLENMQGAVAEYEREKILERTRRGKLHKARRGCPVGGWAPYGYKYMPGDRNKHEDGRFEVVPREAEVVQLIFRLVAHDHLSVRAVARELTRRGTRPQRGKLWRTSTIHRILRNKDYPTCITYFNRRMSVEPENGRSRDRYRRRKNTARRLRPEDQWVPIRLPSPSLVDEKTFEQAQRQLALNAERSSRNTKHDYLLRKLGRCGECDSPLYGTAYHGKLYYACGNRHRTFPLKKECPVGSFRAEPLEDAVWKKVCEAIADPELILSQVGKLRERAGKAQASLKREIERQDRSLAATGQEERRVLEAYREEVISLDQLRDQIGRVNEKKARLSAEREALAARLNGDGSGTPDKDDAARYCARVREALSGLNGDFEGKRRILGLLVDKIVVQGKSVRIRGIIPGSSADGEAQGDSAAIASTTYWCHERNTASLEFELETSIP